jgi:chemotaxis response regulator CheB
MAGRGERGPAKRLVSDANPATRFYSRVLEYFLPRRDIVVVGASSGGVEALMRLASGLPADLPAALFMVVHFPPMAPSILPRILDCSGPLEVIECEDGARKARPYLRRVP